MPSLHLQCPTHPALYSVHYFHSSSYIPSQQYRAIISFIHHGIVASELPPALLLCTTCIRHCSVRAISDINACELPAYELHPVLLVSDNIVYESQAGSNIDVYEPSQKMILTVGRHPIIGRRRCCIRHSDK